MLMVGSCVAGAVVALVVYALRHDPEPIFGVYHQPGKWYWLKYVLFYGIYYFRKVSHKNAAAGEGARAGTGVRAHADPAAMDKAQQLSDDANAFDAVFFIAAKEGDSGEGFYVQAGCERRQMGICSGLFYLGIPGKGLLCSKNIPDTLLFGAEAGQFGAEGLLIVPVEPMNKWTVSYKGQMWYAGGDPSKLVDVEFQGEWTAKWRHFDYDTDLHPAAVVRSIASQPWSREYFQQLKTAHQSHYEQFGAMRANFTVDGESYQVEMNAFRDHSFGHKRDWSLMHRYAFHHIFLEDDTCMSVGVICQPSTSTSFEVGVVALPNGDVAPVEWVDLQLYQHGEGGQAPRQHAFRFKAADRIYTVEVMVEHESVHYKGADWECRMVERFCQYTVNGIPGRGTSEFQYRWRGGRPAEHARTDPDWYRRMCHEL